MPICRFEVIMDNMIKEHLSNFSTKYVVPVNVDEEQIVYTFDEYGLTHFIAAVIDRVKELAH